MTFIEFHRVQDGLLIRVNMDHVSEYFKNLLAGDDSARLIYEDGKQLDVMESATYIDGKIHEIEEWRINARNRT